MNEYSYLDLIQFVGKGYKLKGYNHNKRTRRIKRGNNAERRAGRRRARKLMSTKGGYNHPSAFGSPAKIIDKGRRRPGGPFSTKGSKQKEEPETVAPQIKKEPEVDPLKQYQQEMFEMYKNRDLQPKADTLNQYLQEHPEEINAYFRYASGNPNSTMEVQPFDFSREYNIKYDPENPNIKYMSPYEYEELNRDNNPSFQYSAVDPDFNINMSNAFEKGNQYYEEYYGNEDKPYMIPGEAFAEGIMNLQYQEQLARKRANQLRPPINNEYLESLQEQNNPFKAKLMPKSLHLKKGGIYIKPENRGKFTETMERTGKTAEELAHSPNPKTRKRAIFCLNARKWHHK